MIELEKRVCGNCELFGEKDNICSVSGTKEPPEKLSCFLLRYVDRGFESSLLKRLGTEDVSKAIIEVGEVKEEDLSEEGVAYPASKKLPRPKILPGDTIEVETNCGKLYVTLSTKNNHPFEVFAHLGKSGSCARSQTEGITRCITTGLRHGVPLEEYIKQLSDIICSSPKPFPKEEGVLSCSDAIARALKKLTSKKENRV